MPRSRNLAATLALLVLSTTVLRGEEAKTTRTFAVRTLPGSGALEAAVKDGGFQRWVLPRDDSLALVMGPEAKGEVLVEARVFPAEERLQGLLADLPVTVDGDAVAVDGTSYPAPDYALAARLPEAPGRTWVVIGYDARAAAALTDQVLMREAGVYFMDATEEVDYLLYEHPYSRRSGQWRRAADGGWTVDSDERDDIAARAATYAALVALERPRLVLRVPPGRAADPAYAALADALDAAVAEMAPRVPVAPERPLEVLVEEDFVAQGRHLADIGEAVLDDAGRLHLVYHSDDLDAYRHGVARALVRRAGLGLPPWLEDGAALWLAGGWYGRPYTTWLPDLAAAEVLPSAAELTAGVRQADGSTVLWPPVAAAVIAELEGATLAAKLRTPPATERVARALARIAAQPPRPPRPIAKKAAGTGGFHAGVSLAMRNGLEVGYHAPGVDEQLARLARLGVDSVSLMPFAGSAANEPRLRFFNGSPGSETDVGLIHAARRAHARGFRVFWKPHLWVSHASWPGDIAMTSEAGWQAWWRSYRRYVVHHAALAEWTGSELFSIGVELGRTLEREAEWRALIAAVRRFYSGPLTYCGNWWGDYDRAPFWEELDYVGVDAYFPLGGDGAGRDALAAGARRAAGELAAAAERYGRPVLLTEIGFAARKGAWVAPHEEGGEFDEADQALAYEVFLEALGHPPWLAGVYFWKVFSDPSRTAGEGSTFEFLGRSAEAAVRGYLRAAPAPVSTPE